jgi:hypothetical protein
VFRVCVEDDFLEKLPGPLVAKYGTLLKLGKHTEVCMYMSFDFPNISLTLMRDESRNECGSSESSLKIARHSFLSC